MNRMMMGLALGAGYFLGRTKKLKLAIGVGTLVAGKRLNLTPGAVMDLVSQQLKDNPQLKQLGDELRTDLGGVGKAASGALVERQLGALADQLHGRTAGVRDRLATTVGDADEPDDTEDTEETEGAEGAEGAEEQTGEGEEAEETEGAKGRQGPEGRSDGAKRTRRNADAPARQGSTARKAPAKKPAAKTASRTTPGGKSAAKRTAGARNQAAGTGSRAAERKGGGER
ncbi:DNA primase [Streptomyces sp. NPDC056716]|uniref:DNA primase n=1 Tax=unclassified Streptomyces TaxID=2593676 RepID=UPI0036BAC89B